MRHVCAVVFCLAVVSNFSSSQESRADLYGGYSYVNIDTNGLTSRQNANGWEAAISGNFNKWFAVEGDVSGYYKTYSANPSTGCVYFGACYTASAKIADYSYAAGPRINIRPVFIHALFGGDHLTGTVTTTGVANVSESQDGAAGLAGGGVQFRVSGPWSVRASADYVFTRHNIFGGPSVTQNNYRAGVGIVYSFGTRHGERAMRVPAPPAPANTQPPPTPHATPPAQRATSTGLRIDPLGVTVRLGQNTGAEITDEAPNGVSALAGLHVGDVINAVDGKPVKTPMELAAELANRPTGDKVRLGYMLHGAWQTETVVLLTH
jgi:hypothetical protein